MTRPIRALLLKKVLLPLGSLAILLVVYNGWSRYSDANLALDSTRNLLVDVLRQPAIEAILIGNSSYLVNAIENLAQIQQGAECILVTDGEQNVLTDYGQCASERWQVEGKAFELIAAAGSLDGLVDTEEAARTIGEISVIMKRDALYEQVLRIGLLLAVSITALIAVFFAIVKILRREVVEPIESISEAMSLVRGKDYSARVAPLRSRSELADLTHSINETIHEMEQHTAELDAKRQEAENAMLAADTAFIEKESLIQALMQDVAEPLSEISRGLALLAMDRVGSPDDQTVRRLAEHAKRSGDNVSELLHLVMSSVHENETSLLTAGELADALEATLLELKREAPIEIQRLVTKMESENRADDVVIRAPSVKLQRLIHTVGKATADYAQGADLEATIGLLKTSDEHLEVSLDIRILSHVALWEEKYNEVDTGLPRDIPERARTLASLLSRDIDAHVHSIFGGRNSLLVTVRWQTKLETSANGSEGPEQLRSDIAIVTNDQALQTIAVKGSMAGRQVHIIRPADVEKRMSDLGQHVDFVAIDIGRGSVDDFDSNHVLETIITQDANKKYHFIAIVEENALADSLVDELFRYGYSSTLIKPFSWKSLQQRIDDVAAMRVFDASVFKKK